MPQLLFGEQAGLLEHGWYPSVCAHSSSYGFGKTGFFVALFIYSKLAELLVSCRIRDADAEQHAMPATFAPRARPSAVRTAHAGL